MNFIFDYKKNIHFLVNKYVIFAVVAWFFMCVFFPHISCSCAFSCARFILFYIYPQLLFKCCIFSSPFHVHEIIRAIVSVCQCSLCSVVSASCARVYTLSLKMIFGRYIIQYISNAYAFIHIIIVVLVRALCE